MRIVLGLVLALFLSVPAWAQTYLTSTTNSAAITSTQTTFAVASATGIAAGGALYVDREWMPVRSVSGVNITVLRGQAGTVANAHGASRTVVIIPVAAVALVPQRVEPAGSTGLGTCTVANHRFLPYINLTNGNLWLCLASVWKATNATPITYNSLYLDPS
jgi:hypothetical protein